MTFQFSLFTAVVMALASPAQAFSCFFDTECVETDPCHETEFLVDVIEEEKLLSTNFGDKTILAIKRDKNLITFFATGHGAEYMMSVTPDGARLSTQVNDGPMVFGYLGQCEGAF